MQVLAGDPEEPAEPGCPKEVELRQRDDPVEAEAVVQVSCAQVDQRVEVVVVHHLHVRVARELPGTFDLVA